MLGFVVLNNVKQNQPRVLLLLAIARQAPQLSLSGADSRYRQSAKTFIMARGHCRDRCIKQSRRL